MRNLSHVRDKRSIVIRIVPRPRNTTLKIVPEIPNQTLNISQFNFLQKLMVVFFGYSKLILIINLFIIRLKSKSILLVLFHLFDMISYRITFDLLFDEPLNVLHLLLLLSLKNLLLILSNFFGIIFSFTLVLLLSTKGIHVFLHTVQNDLLSVNRILTLPFSLLINFNQKLLLCFGQQNKKPLQNNQIDVTFGSQVTFQRIQILFVKFNQKINSSLFDWVTRQMRQKIISNNKTQ